MNHKRYATIHVISLPQDPDLEDWYTCITFETLKSAYPDIELDRGDMIEVCELSGYRSEGVCMWNGQHTIGLNTNCDDYGSVAEEFTALRDFPGDYWTYDNMEQRCWAGTPKSEWHGVSLVKLDQATIMDLEAAEVLKCPETNTLYKVIQFNRDFIDIVIVEDEPTSTYIMAYDEPVDEGFHRRAVSVFPNLRSISIN